MTTIFSDVFESNDFTAWTATVNANGGTIAVQSTVKHHGDYAQAVTVADASPNAYGASYIIFGSSYTTIYGRSVHQWSAFPITNGKFHCAKFKNTANGDTATWGLLKDADGHTAWFIYNAATTTYYTYEEVINIDTQYTLEAKVVISATVGELRLYRNGTEIITQTGLNTGATAIQRFYTGLFNAVSGDTPAGTFYTDCVVVADAYIGPEAAAGQQLFCLLNEMNY
jgi:hypothetical protein